MSGATIYAPADVIWGRILARVEEQPNGCWRWTGTVNSRGYGCIGAGKRSRTVLVHRVALLVRDGELHEGLTADHICHNQDRECPGGMACEHRRCVNPDHLEQVTGLVNRQRAARRHYPPPRELTAADIAARDALKVAIADMSRRILANLPDEPTEVA